MTQHKVLSAEVRNDIPDGDYTLTDGAAWFTVKNFSIRIHATDEGVICDVYPLHRECEPSLASCYAFDSEAEEVA